MDKFVINGGKKLSGTVRTDGSKNAALPIIVASMLIDNGETTLENIPPLRDINTIRQVLEHLGGDLGEVYGGPVEGPAALLPELLQPVPKVLAAHPLLLIA